MRLCLQALGGQLEAAVPGENLGAAYRVSAILYSKSLGHLPSHKTCTFVYLAAVVFFELDLVCIKQNS